MDDHVVDERRGELDCCPVEVDPIVLAARSPAVSKVANVDEGAVSIDRDPDGTASGRPDLEVEAGDNQTAGRGGLPGLRIDERRTRHPPPTSLVWFTRANSTTRSASSERRSRPKRS